MTPDIKTDAPLPPEINKYLAILSKDPGSMVFAPLTEAYRKAGNLDEAIAVAQDGLNIHPNYVSGMVALGRAYFDKGMISEAKETLDKVLVLAPDNIIAANILEEIKKKLADKPEVPIIPAPLTSPGQALSGSAEEAELEELTELEEFTELTEVEAEEKLGDFQVEQISFEAPEPGLGLVKEVREREEEKTAEDIVSWGEETVNRLEEEGSGITEVSKPDVLVSVLYEEEKEARPRKEINTETIADLYIKQGYFDKAIDIYQTLYDADPGNDDIKRKLDELKKEVVVKVEEQEAKKGRIEPTRQGPGLKTDENIDRLESWLETIQSERRKG
jgi:tetratricopeptide (TPR) repeat protein